MQPETMNVEEARHYLAQHFGRPVDEVDTSELEQLYDKTTRQAKESAYTDAQVELLHALNLVLMGRQNE